MSLFTDHDHHYNNHPLTWVIRQDSDEWVLAAADGCEIGRFPTEQDAFLGRANARYRYHNDSAWYRGEAPKSRGPVMFTAETATVKPTYSVCYLSEEFTGRAPARPCHGYTAVHQWYGATAPGDTYVYTCATHRSPTGGELIPPAWHALTVWDRVIASVRGQRGPSVRRDRIAAAKRAVFGLPDNCSPIELVRAEGYDVRTRYRWAPLFLRAYAALLGDHAGLDDIDRNTLPFLAEPAAAADPDLLAEAFAEPFQYDQLTLLDEVFGVSA